MCQNKTSEKLFDMPFAYVVINSHSRNSRSAMCPPKHIFSSFLVKQFLTRHMTSVLLTIYFSIYNLRGVYIFFMIFVDLKKVFRNHEFVDTAAVAAVAKCCCD